MGKKLDDATATQKALAINSIFLMLRDGQTVSLKKLSEDLKCSRATVLRRIEDLEYGKISKVVKTVINGENHYAYARPRRMPKVCITSEGLQQIMLCRDFMDSFMPDSMRALTRATISQAQAFLPADENADLTSLGESYNKGQIDYTPFEKQLQTIVQCMRNKQVCQIEYQSSLRQEPRVVEIAPLRLQMYRGAMYVRAWAVTDKGKPEAKYKSPTTYALQRIKNAWATCRTTGHLPDVVSGTKGFGFIKGEPFSAKIRFSPTVSTYVAERRWSANQRIDAHDDGSITLTMSATSDRELISWVLGFGKEATLLEPANIRAEIASELAAVQAQYA